MNFISIHSLPHKHSLPHYLSRQSYLPTVSKLARYMPCSFSCPQREVSGKNISLMLCFNENKLCWQSAEIRPMFHTGAIYAKRLALITLSLVILMKKIVIALRYSIILRFIVPFNRENNCAVFSFTLYINLTPTNFTWNAKQNLIN